MREHIVGRVFPGLKVVAKAGKDRTRHTMVIVKCFHCGKVSPTPMRWSDVKRGAKDVYKRQHQDTGKSL